LYGNEISEILPGTFKKMGSLQNLWLGNNSMEYLNVDAFSGLISLDALLLDSNKLQYLYPNTFESLPNLRILHLNNNSGLQIPTDRPFINSHSLLFLGLSNCNVSSVSVETFANVSALKGIDLSYNNLRTVDVKILRALPELSLILVYDNPLECDCQLQEVWRWCKDHNIYTKNGEKEPKCKTPSEVEGMWWVVLEKGECLQGSIQYGGYYNRTNN
jgi:Leucine-rich repeat (LRR) protein